MRGAASQHRQNFTTLRSFASLLPLQLSKLFPHPPNPPATLTPSMHTTNPLATAIHVIIAQHTQLFHIHSRSIQYTSWGFPEDGLFGHGVPVFSSFTAQGFSLYIFTHLSSRLYLRLSLIGHPYPASSTHGSSYRAQDRLSRQPSQELQSGSNYRKSKAVLLSIARIVSLKNTPRTMSAARRSIVLFRPTDLRLLDNLALRKAVETGGPMLAVYCFDPRHHGTSRLNTPRLSVTRARFLLESVSTVPGTAPSPSPCHQC